MSEYTKGEWEVKPKCPEERGIIINGEDGGIIARVTTVGGTLEEAEANAHLIAAAPLGYELAEFVAGLSATWIGEADYAHMKEIALKLKTKVRGKSK